MLRMILLGSIWNIIIVCKGGDFVTTQLDVGEVQHVFWKEDGKKVDEYAVQIGLPSELTTALINYCKEIGIWDLFWNYQYDSPLSPGKSNYFLDKNGNQWQVNRPDSKWQSDMHWIQPSKEDTHEAYLRVLSDGDFDTVLKGIGGFYPHLDTLAIHSVGFVSVSHCTQGFMHYDTTETDGRQFNLLFPLHTVRRSGPEFVIRDDTHERREGLFKYKRNVGVMVGDDTYHGTNACDYRGRKDVRIAATIYMNDINEKNAMIIANDDTSIFPLPGDVQWTLAQRGRHWSRDGTSSLKYDRGRTSLTVMDEWDTDHCQQLASKGECENDPFQIRAYCTKSCGVLSSTLYPDDSEEDEEL